VGLMKIYILIIVINVSVLSKTISAASLNPYSLGFNSIGPLLEQFE
jgi:hypothetical protein